VVEEGDSCVLVQRKRSVASLRFLISQEDLLIYQKNSGVRIVVRSGMRAVAADVGCAFEIDKALRCPRDGG
jgi:hypothetical protein